MKIVGFNVFSFLDLCGLNSDVTSSENSAFGLENDHILSDNKSLLENMNPPDANASSPGNHDAAARDKLVALRLALLRVHKTLLDMERREYERVNGKVNVGEFFRLVIDHQQFGWLHNISEFVVRLDETLAGENPVTQEDVRTAISLARKMFAPSESGDAFQKKYFDAIQTDPAVVIDHAELVRLFNNEPPDVSSP
ncbi:MAG: hypothetical protein WA765_13435 [Candidatus Acidiferrum sp.]